MTSSLWANVRVHLKFYRRNRLLLVAALLIGVIIGISMIPSLFFYSVTNRFRILMQIFSMSTFFLGVMLALIALISVWYHRSQKCVKLVFTRPCTPANWLLSHYLSALLVYLMAMGVVVLLIIVLFAVWGIPWQWGFLAAVYYDFVTTALLFSLLLMLSAYMHPVLAFIVWLLLQDGMYYYLSLFCRAGAEFLERDSLLILLAALRRLFEGLYFIAPMGSPFAEELSKLQSGFRLEDGGLKYLAGGTVYLALFGALMFAATCYALKRQRHV